VRNASLVGASDDSIIENIDISYRVASSTKMSNFLIYRDILRQRFIFLLLHYKNNENKQTTY